MIKLQGLNKKYGKSVVFENASFEFPDKGLVCVLGASGCGKSTLLNLIAGFDSMYDGDIFVHSTSISKMNAADLCAYRRDNIGFVFQNYHLISGYTALENVLLPCDAVGESHETSVKKANDLLEKLGLSEKSNQRVETLSGGQKQRVAIARTLINNPSIILADEPTGALDRQNSTEIMQLLKTLSESRLVLVITHDKKCAEFADEVVTICNGTLTSENESENLIETTVLKARKAVKIPIWKMAMKNFKVHLPRSTAIALAVSISVLCFVLSLSSGNIIKQSIEDFRQKNTAYHNGYIKADGNELELTTLLSKDNRIENIYSQYMLADVAVKIGEQTVNMPEKYPMPKATEKMSYGVMPRVGRNEIALSPSLAAKFDRNIQNLIGKSVEITVGDKAYTVTVSGIFNASYDDFFVSSDIEQQMYKDMTDKAYSVSYDVIQFENIVLVSDSLQEQEIEAKTASAEVEAFLDTFKNLNRLFLTVSLLIFAIGLFISAILLVKQQNTRFNEVGLLSALGYTKGSIRNVLLSENIALSVVSVICNLGLTVAAFIIGKAVGFSLMFTLPQVLMALCFTVAIVLVIGMLSSIRLIRTEPAQALRK